MLTHLLQLLNQGTIHTPPALAAALGVPEALVVQMAEQLTRQGYLKESDSCGLACQGCALQQGCQAARPAHTWALTEKGAKMLARL